jgi:hypothetical protein
VGNRADNLDEVDGYTEQNAIKDKTIVLYCGVMGNMHNGIKLNNRQQRMNGRCYTPTMKCAFSRCTKATRVICYQCHAPF